MCRFWQLCNCTYVNNDTSQISNHSPTHVNFFIQGGVGQPDWDQLFNGMMSGTPEDQLQKMMESMKSDDPSMFNQFEQLASAANNIGFTHKQIVQQ